MRLTINGEARDIGLSAAQNTLQNLVEILSLKADQVAIEQNGSIVRRTEWTLHPVREGDRFEIVQFVGGGY